MDQRSKLRGKRIAFVFQVEFEPLVRKDCCASRRPAIPPGKRQGGVLQQENSADPPLGVTGDPKAFLVAADEKCRDRLIEDAGIERLKLRDDGRRFGRRGCGTESDRGHSGLLTNLTAMMCRRCRRNARWV